MDKRFLGILAVLAILFVGIFAISQRSTGSTNTGGNTSAQPSNHVQGQNQKGVVLLEYGDYECPICEAYYIPLKTVVAKNSADILFQFRNLPLTAIHQNAFAGARAAEAASLQGKFWQMHDKLYDNQNQWATSSDPQTFFNQYAQQIGLNSTQFKQDYASTKVNDTINADLNAFNKTGAEKATPSIFLNGKSVSLNDLVDPQTGQPSADRIDAVVKAEIDKQSK